MYCHALPCTAMHCHVLPCTAMYCHALPCTAMYFHVLQYMYYPINIYIPEKPRIHEVMYCTTCTIPSTYISLKNLGFMKSSTAMSCHTLSCIGMYLHLSAYTPIYASFRGYVNIMSVSLSALSLTYRDPPCASFEAYVCITCVCLRGACVYHVCVFPPSPSLRGMPCVVFSVGMYVSALTLT
jgi:hypothetical protein